MHIGRLSRVLGARFIFSKHQFWECKWFEEISGCLSQQVRIFQKKKSQCLLYAVPIRFQRIGALDLPAKSIPETVRRATGISPKYSQRLRAVLRVTSRQPTLEWLAHVAENDMSRFRSRDIAHASTMLTPDTYRSLDSVGFAGIHSHFRLWGERSPCCRIDSPCLWLARLLIW